MFHFGEFCLEASHDQLQDYDLALSYWERASALGHLGAETAISKAIRYAHLRRFPVPEVEPLVAGSSAAARAVARAEAAVAELIRNAHLLGAPGQDVSLTQRDRGLEHLLHAARCGESEAQHICSGMYLLGARNVPMDRELAAVYTEASASRGFWPAQDKLYRSACAGRDDIRAVHWLHRMGEDGDARSMSLLGELYFRGVRGLSEDLVMANSCWFVPMCV
jgi:Sel1 repeat.